MHIGGSTDLEGGKHARTEDQCRNARVGTDFEDRGCRFKRRVDNPRTRAVPSATEAIGAFATVPGLGKTGVVEAPRYEFASAEAHLAEASSIDAILDAIEICLDEVNAHRRTQHVDWLLAAEADCGTFEPTLAEFLRSHDIGSKREEFGELPRPSALFDTERLFRVFLGPLESPSAESHRLLERCVQVENGKPAIK